MAVDESYLKFIQDQLSEFGEFEIKRMFGGIGMFKDGLMFGKIGGNTFRLKVNETNKAAFEARGMKPFVSATKKKGMPYWEVPQEILEDRSLLAEWANTSVGIAIRAAEGKKN